MQNWEKEEPFIESIIFLATEGETVGKTSAAH